MTPSSADRNPVGSSRRFLLRNNDTAQKEHREHHNEPPKASSHERLQELYFDPMNLDGRKGASYPGPFARMAELV